MFWLDILLTAYSFNASIEHLNPNCRTRTNCYNIGAIEPGKVYRYAQWHMGLFLPKKLSIQSHPIFSRHRNPHDLLGVDSYHILVWIHHDTRLLDNPRNEIWPFIQPFPLKLVLMEIQIKLFSISWDQMGGQLDQRTSSIFYCKKKHKNIE